MYVIGCDSMTVISVSIKGKNNSCEECRHCNMDTHPYFYGCQRLQHEEYDLISGKIKWVGKLLNCRRERGVNLDWWDKLMIMFSWHRCGKDGQYWISRSWISRR